MSKILWFNSNKANNVLKIFNPFFHALQFTRLTLWAQIVHNFYKNEKKNTFSIILNLSLTGVLNLLKI